MEKQEESTDTLTDPEERPVFVPYPRTGIRKKIGDFSNVFKSFIGSNYLGLPFGFYQSGLVLGCIILFVVVIMTDHCCQLIVKCKKYLVDELCEKYERETSKLDDGSYRQRLERSLRYADIGRLCFGRPGVVIVDFFLVLTQTGFCIAYFIFIGNTVHAMFPLKEVTVPLTTSSLQNITAQADYYHFDHIGRPVKGYDSLESYLLKNNANLDNVALKVGDVSPTAAVFTDFAVDNRTTLEPMNRTVTGTASYLTVGTASYDRNRTGGVSTSSRGTITTGNKTTATPWTSTPGNMTTATPSTTPFINTTTVPPTNESLIPANNTSDHVFISSAPDLKWLVLVPLLPFILFTYVQNIRKLGLVSLMANVAIFVGYFVTLIYMLVDIKIDPGIVYFRWETALIFFGQCVGAFEGIGLVIPVEASMEGNQKRFPRYLHGALFSVSSILASFGIIGYLRFGSHVQQVIVKNLPPFSVFSLCIDACLIIAIGCTYPLMIFPVVQILELYILKIGHVQDDSLDDDASEQELDDDDSDETTALIQKQKNEVPTWKRNILRTLVVLVVAGLSVLLRNDFAYISALVGACGSTALAYVLPCLFHIKLRGRQLHPLIIVKNIVVIVIGIIGGVCGVVITIQEIIKGFETRG